MRVTVPDTVKVPPMLELSQFMAPVADTDTEATVWGLTPLSPVWVKVPEDTDRGPEVKELVDTATVAPATVKETPEAERVPLRVRVPPDKVGGLVRVMVSAAETVNWLVPHQANKLAHFLRK